MECDIVLSISARYSGCINDRCGGQLMCRKLSKLHFYRTLSTSVKNFVKLSQKLYTGPFFPDTAVQSIGAIYAGLFA